MASKTLEEFGEISIHENSQVRELVAESIATRENRSVPFMVDRLNQLHRITPYDEEGREASH